MIKKYIKHTVETKIFFSSVTSLKELWELEECTNRVCHAAELAYVFGVVELTDFEYTPEEKTLSDHMIKYWTNFAKYANPNGPNNEVKMNYTIYTFTERLNKIKSIVLQSDKQYVFFICI